jgi:thiol-disulfide isomerase/thioredoxin
MDRLRHLSTGLLSFAMLAAVACSKGDKPGPTVAEVPRTVGIGGEPDPAALKTFCDKSWGPGEQAFGDGPRLKEPGKPPTNGWRWVNYWATWCAPCLEEMPMLGRWRDGLVKEGVPFELELWSVDEDEVKLRERVQKGLPAAVKWVDGPEALSEFLGKLGLDPDSMLPIHMLVDAKGSLRCVRIGAVHENDYGTVRKLIGR